MIKADLIHNKIEILDVSNGIRILLGEKFKLVLKDPPQGVRWFADKDPILSTVEGEGGTSIEVEATAVGISELQLQKPTTGPNQDRLDRAFIIEVFTNNTTALNGSISQVPRD